MNITLFGGTGETGLLVLKKALASGHQVTVFARTPSKIPFQHKRLNVIKGDLFETDHIEKAISEAEVVLSLLGPTGKTKGLVVSEGMKNIVTAMHKYGAKRLIATATPSYPDSRDTFQLSFALAVFMIKTLMKQTYRDIVETGKIVAHSSLDWTLVRLPMLSSKPATGNLKIGYLGSGNVSLFSLSREDLANFLVQQVGHYKYIGEAPVISN